MTTDDTLADAGHSTARRMPMGTACRVHHHREHVPLEQHHVWPQGMGGPNTPENKITVCCNGHYSIHEAMRQLMIHNGRVPWDIYQHFSTKVRTYALQGWVAAGRPTHGGTGE